MQGTLSKDFEAIGMKESQLYVHRRLPLAVILILFSKSENDDLKREVESLKAPSTAVSIMQGCSDEWSHTDGP